MTSASFEPVNVAPLLPLAVGTPVLRAPPRRRAAFAGAVAVAASVHAGLFAWLVIPEHVLQAGGGGDNQDAISVELVRADALALQSVTDARQAGVAAAGSLDLTTASIGQPTPPEPAAPPTVEPQPAAERPVEAVVTVPTPPAPPAPAEAAPASASSIGMATAETTPSIEAAAAVSAGSVDRFARSVIDALSKSRNSGARPSASGTVKVMFGLREDGALDFARVATSSGNPTLDAAALAFVQRVNFPRPPAGLTPAHRTYLIPIR